jgi:tetratricopeptide (TPR) repeat protein
MFDKSFEDGVYLLADPLFAPLAGNLDVWPSTLKDANGWGNFSAPEWKSDAGHRLSLRATFETLLDVDPSAHYAHYALGQSLKQLGRAKEARTHLKLAVALSPNSRLYQAALDRLGSVPGREA